MWAVAIALATSQPNRQQYPTFTLNCRVSSGAQAHNYAQLTRLHHMLCQYNDSAKCGVCSIQSAGADSQEMSAQISRCESYYDLCEHQLDKQRLLRTSRTSRDPAHKQMATNYTNYRICRLGEWMAHPILIN